MSKLSEFYAHKSSLISSGEMTPAQWDALEERLIKEDVLPELLQQLRAVLCQVKSPLMLSISYDPNGALAVSFTRNCMQMQVPVIPTSSPVEEEPVAELETEVVTMQEPEAMENIEPEQDLTAELVTDDSTEIESEDGDEQITRSKSIGFTVAFPDGTVIHEKKAVKTFIAALQKIGLQRIARGNHGVQHAGFNVVGTEKREADTKKQEYVDGYYIYTHMSNPDKIDDLNQLSRYYNLQLTVVSDEAEQPATEPSATENITQRTTESVTNNSIRGQFRRFMLKTKAQGTANSYISTLNSAVRTYINEHIDANADSIFSFTTTEDVGICIDMLNSTSEFVKDNEARHNFMSAALAQYKAFIESGELQQE